MTGAGVLVVFIGTAFLVGSRADVDRPAAAPLTTIAEPSPPDGSGPVQESAARTPPRRSGAVVRARRFAWPPVVGASGYHVELFKDSTLIFRERTEKPEILIRGRWRFGDRLRTLEPGAYRWYVWALVGGERKANAIVQARLVVAR